MNGQLMLRYVGEGGPIQVWVNGFLLVNDIAGERSGTRIEPYVLPGNNLLRIDASSAPNAKVTVEIVLASEDGRSAVPVSQAQLPDPRAQGGVLQLPFRLAPDLPTWNWTQLQPAPPGVEATLHSFLVGFASLLARGPDDDLLRQVAYKHTEVGAALGYAKPTVDQGLLQDLAAQRSAPGFRVDVAAPGDLVPMWSPDRRLLRPLRRNRQDAVAVSLDGRLFGFELVLGHHRGNWIIIR
jgi:hypothetical protein